MTGQVQPVVMALVGAAVLKIAWGDAYLNYVKEGLRPFLIASGLVLLVLGLVGAWRDGDRGHHHDHGQPRVAWLLLLPVATLFLVAPPALGADAAARDRGTVPDPGPVEFAPLPQGDPVKLTVLDYAVRASWGGADTLRGRQFRMLGFVTPAGDGDSAGGWYLTRIALACCAADGQATKVLVIDAPAPPADTWVEVVGDYVPVARGEPGSVPAAVRALSITVVDPPRKPYL